MEEFLTSIVDSILDDVIKEKQLRAEKANKGTAAVAEILIHAEEEEVLG